MGLEALRFETLKWEKGVFLTLNLSGYESRRSSNMKLICGLNRTKRRTEVVVGYVQR